MNRVWNSNAQHVSTRFCLLPMDKLKTCILQKNRIKKKVIDNVEQLCQSSSGVLNKKAEHFAPEKQLAQIEYPNVLQKNVANFMDSEVCDGQSENNSVLSIIQVN